MIEQGAVGGVPLLDFQFGCASNADAIMPSPASVHLFPGRRLRLLAALLPGNRPVRLGQRLAPFRPSACDGRRRRLRRHHGTGEAHRLLRLCSMPAPSSRSWMANSSASLKEGKLKKLVQRGRACLLLRPPRGRAGPGNNSMSPSAAVMRLTREGMMLDEIAPGFDLERDILDQADFPLIVADDLKVTHGSALSCRRADRPPCLREASMAEPAGEARVQGQPRRSCRHPHAGRRPEKAQCARPGDDGRASRPGWMKSRRTARSAPRSSPARARRSFPPAATSPPGPGSSRWTFMRDWVRNGHRVFDRLARLRQPLIAVVNGHAFGGGLELAATADLIAILPRSTAGSACRKPGSAWCRAGRARSAWCAGSVRASSAAWCWPARCSRPRARWRMASGRYQVVPKGEGLAAGIKLAIEAIAARGPIAVQLSEAADQTPPRARRRLSPSRRSPVHPRRLFR